MRENHSVAVEPEPVSVQVVKWFGLVPFSFQFLLGLAAVFASYHQRKAWLGGIDSCVLSYFSGILQ